MSDYKKINKPTARKLFNKGERVFLLPCKCAVENMWIKPLGVSILYDRPFDAIVNEFEFYNCCREWGYYTNFYIEA